MGEAAPADQGSRRSPRRSRTSIDQNGDIQAEGQIDSQTEAIDRFPRNLELELTTIGLEAGTLAQCLTYGLRDSDYQGVCMEARQVKVALSAIRNTFRK